MGLYLFVLKILASGQSYIKAQQVRLREVPPWGSPSQIHSIHTNVSMIVNIYIIFGLDSQIASYIDIRVLIYCI